MNFEKSVTRVTPVNIDEILQRRRILVTCGTGGVGKTTLSATLALRAALLGKRAVVITIDPAKRLATSLGLKSLGDHPTDLTEQLKKAAKREVPGTFSAIIPDTRKTFDQFVRTLITKEEEAERIFRNPIYQIFAREFSGANEYMALQRLYALDRLKEYDCIILDTPPSRNTLAFLDAPKLLARFFEDKLIQLLVLPANKLVAGGMKKALGLLSKLTGENFMTHLFDFASALFEVRHTFAANLKSITDLLESQAVGFVLVAAPTPQNTSEIGHFINSLTEHRFRFDGMIINRALGYLKETQSTQTSVPLEIQDALNLIDAISKQETLALDSLAARLTLSNDGYKGQMTDQVFCAKLPELARDIHSVEDLFHVAMVFDSAQSQLPIHFGTN